MLVQRVENIAYVFSLNEKYTQHRYWFESRTCPNSKLWIYLGQAREMHSQQQNEVSSPW